MTDRREIYRLVDEAKMSPDLPREAKSAMVRYIVRLDEGEIETSGTIGLVMWKSVARACGGSLDDFLAISLQVPVRLGPGYYANDEWIDAVVDRLR